MVMHVAPETFLGRVSERPVGGLRGVSREGSVSGAYLDTQGPMDIVDLPNTEPMRCPREDVAKYSVTGVWF